MSNIYDDMLVDARVAFDIGAHRGDFTDFLLRQGLRLVIAVEPQEKVYMDLLDRMKGDTRVIALQTAVYSRTGTVEMHICNQASTLSTLNERWRFERFPEYIWEDDPIQVDCVTLDSLIKTLGAPDFIKIDVEGSEDHVLRGLSTPIKAISFEFDEMFPEVTRACLEKLDQLGEYRFLISRGDFVGADVEEIEGSASLLQQIGSAYRNWGMIHAIMRNP